MILDERRTLTKGKGIDIVVVGMPLLSAAKCRLSDFVNSMFPFPYINHSQEGIVQPLNRYSDDRLVLSAESKRR